jgi:hypothetical protein
MSRPRPDAKVSSDQLQVGHHDERTDVEQRGATPRDEPEQAREPERAQRIRTRCERGDPPQRVAAAHQQHRRHQQPAVPLEQRGPSQRQRTEIDQTMTGRHERRHVVEAVDVHVQTCGERVFDEGREGDHDSYLNTDQRCLAGQQGDQQDPRTEAPRVLRSQRLMLVGDQHQRDPRENADRRHPVSLTHRPVLPAAARSGRGGRGRPRPPR